MSLDFPLLVRSRNFCFFFCLGGGKGAVFLLCFCPFPEKGILDFIAHRPIIQDFTVLEYILMKVGMALKRTKVKLM